MSECFAKRTIISTVVAVALCVTGCSTPGGTTGVAGDSAGDECNPGLALAAGALLGALLGDGNNRVRGAAIGAGLASLACVAWNYNVKQSKSAAQVQQEYRNTNAGPLPTQTTLQRYDARFEPTATVTPGGKLTVVSNIDVLQGTANPMAAVEEELTLVLPDGSEKKMRKKAESIRGTGGYTTSFSIPMPQGVPQGVYPVRTALFLNGTQAGSKNLQMQVVSLPNDNVAEKIKEADPRFSELLRM
ncbi:MAG: glycine zipper domain-containing protein [Betaproteobacteria bacterium]